MASELDIYLKEAGFEVGLTRTSKIKFGDYKFLEKCRFGALIKRLIPGASPEAIAMAAIATSQLEEGDYTTL